jgi:hypothetical protein
MTIKERRPLAEMTEEDFTSLRNTSTGKMCTCTFIDPDGELSEMGIEVLQANAKIRRGAFILLTRNWDFDCDGRRGKSWPALSAKREDFGRAMLELARKVVGCVVRIEPLGGKGKD